MLWTTWNAIQNILEVPIPLGYCCAGEVVETGEGVDGFLPGDRVASGGAALAFHAEATLVPKNLVVKVPKGADMRHMAFTTLGSIAMQGVRFADIRLGENVLVIGLGSVGLLTTELLRVAGNNAFLFRFFKLLAMIGSRARPKKLGAGIYIITAKLRLMGLISLFLVLFSLVGIIEKEYFNKSEALYWKRKN